MFNRSLTRDEHEARTRERFARIDKNGDGALDMAEIEAALAGDGDRRRGWMRERFGRGGDGDGRGPPGDRLIQRFDTDRDGRVTREEFQKQALARFAETDLNNDGRIDDADLPPMMRGRGALTGDADRASPGLSRGGRGGGMMAWLRDADANRDGTITRDEAMAHAMREFDRFDANKDSAVDAADFTALRKEMTDYRVKRFIHHYGGDNDGKVTKDQYFAKARERFAQMDRNNDGTLGRGELPGRGGRFMGRHGGGDMMEHGMHERGIGRGPRGERFERGPDAGQPQPTQPPRN
jgi:Ca2+-binding EF-hand superfamily protein